MEDEKNALNDELLGKVSGGQMRWGRTCLYCGGVTGNDPTIPVEIRCVCKNWIF